VDALVADEAQEHSLSIAGATVDGKGLFLFSSASMQAFPQKYVAS
jgi:hypothetical protein